TAVFAPDPTRLSGAVDVLLWFHGDKHVWSKKRTAQNLKKPRPDKDPDLYLWGESIKTYLETDECKLREVILPSTKKKFRLVAPTLNDQTGVSIDSTNPDESKRDYNPGALRWKQADAEAYLQQVLNGVQRHMKVNNTLTLGNVVLAAHSGGGHLQSQMA